ncbi:hypothetical protein RND71_007118 [Anisodus tanguticus]|uniref:Pectinesterase inhibitor domain-containing protein n=1 Tax=Anisodus tanguticus TaxID=243964 RepID=A0AAE1SL77_9SOLA|nr:hypothetical protein RND71_007118 [Anisodus tanguticus]
MAPPSQLFVVGVAIAIFLTIPSNAFDYSLQQSLSPSSQPSTQNFDVPQSVSKIDVSSENVPSFVKASMVGTMSKTKEFIQNVIEKRLAFSAKMDHYHKDCLETCKEVYEDAIAAMKKAIQDVEEEDFYKANIDIGAMYSFIETCHDCVVETSEIDDPAFQRFQKWAQGIASDCLEKVSNEYYKN